jgi:hypothetical protein
VTAADVRGSAVAANFAAAAGCAFDFDVGFKLAQRAFIDRGRFDLVNSARQRLETAVAPGKD